MAETRSPRTLANELFKIEDACRYLGMDIYGGTDRVKYWCPFGDVFHSDGGRTKAFRLYSNTNSAYCWACGMYFTPVRLMALHLDIEETEAVTWILDHVGYVEPTYQAQWDAIITKEDSVDYDGLTEALKIACARMVPDWEDRQFEPAVAAKLTACLTALKKVSNDEEARKWMSVVKAAMAQVLGVALRSSPLPT